MPKYITVHRAPGLKREEVAANAPEVYGAQKAVFQHLYVNLADGFIVSIFEAPDRATLEEQFEIIGFPFDEIHELQFSQSRAEMEGMLKKMGKLPG
jgi:hypothetical protein